MQKFIDLHSGNEFLPRPSCVLCLGTFDGVHLGHMALINETLAQRSLLSKEYPDILGGAWCFSQPPADFLYSEPVPHITSLDEKLELFAKAGLDIAIIGDFLALRDLSKGEFVQNVLARDCCCVKSVCGFDFRFGKGACGSPSDLEMLPKGNLTVPAVTVGGETVSSSKIRSYIISGELEKAAEMLGRPFSLTLPVIHGKTLGRKLGAPTANQLLEKGTLTPAHGVYATRATVGGLTYPAITNIGTNPTVSDGDSVKAETHILGFSGDIYGDTVKIEFVSYLRREKKFSSKDELAAAIAGDIAKAKKLFKI